MSEELQHAPLLDPRPPVPFTTLDEARESARQLAGPNAEIVHRYLDQQWKAGLDNWHLLASLLATELRYSMSVLGDHHPDEELSDFAWFRDGSEVLAEFDAAEGQPPGGR